MASRFESGCGHQAKKNMQLFAENTVQMALAMVQYTYIQIKE